MTDNQKIISDVFVTILRAYRTYPGYGPANSWVPVLISLNNGDCGWVAKLASKVLLEKYNIVSTFVGSAHHYYLVINNVIYDTLNIIGDHTEGIKTLPFYQHERKELPFDPNEVIRLYSWDKDIKIICDLICGKFQITRFNFDHVIPDDVFLEKFELFEFNSDDLFKPKECEFTKIQGSVKLTNILIN